MSSSTQPNSVLLPPHWFITTKISSTQPANVVTVRQVHGDRIIAANQVCGSEIEADGILTTVDGPPAAIYTADCLPLVIVSKQRALALHVSRKSLIKGLLDKASDLIGPACIERVYVGPHICADHFTFESDGPEIKTFKLLYPTAAKSKDGVWHLSLRQAVQAYLDLWGVPDHKIIDANDCNFESLAPSYRRDGRGTAQIFTVVKVTEQPRLYE